jgi:hypothetical protein
MTEKIASELLVERLIAWDVDTVFCLPGEGINGIMHPARAADRMPGHVVDCQYVTVPDGPSFRRSSRC